MEPDAVEIRVLGCLIEKQRTTPDAYPLSLNALRLACNQATNRNPVVDYDEATIKDALQHSYRRGWTRLASGHGSRAAKYRHLLDDALGLAPDELAVLSVLMLRGPQTPGELKQRTERLHRFDDLAAVEATLASLISRDHAAQLPRQPGQKEQRYAQLLSGDQAEPAGHADPVPAHADPVPAHADPTLAHTDRVGESVPAHPHDSAAPPAESPRATTGPARSSAGPEPEHERRIEQLERDVAELRAQLAALRDELGA